MGTNFYLDTNVCPTCGHPAERLHIGKSSGGWCFALHVDDKHQDLDDWIAAWSQPGAVISDECGDTVDAAAMFSKITERARPVAWEVPLNFAAIDAEEGPNNLLRHRIGGHCIGHGAGTWDLCIGEFS